MEGELMSRILKILLFIVGILIFFEIGLFASYSLISSQPVNPLELLSVQVDSGSDFVSSMTGEKKLNDQDTLNITNDESVALILNNMTNLSTNLNSVTAKISGEGKGNQTVTITALATKDTQINSGGYLQILPEQTYSITATATGEVYSNGKVKINTTSIVLKERIVLYNQNNATSNANNSVDSFLAYSNNKTNTTKNTTVVNLNNNTRK